MCGMSLCICVCEVVAIIIDGVLVSTPISSGTTPISIMDRLTVLHCLCY